MDKKLRLRKNRDFQAVFSSGKGYWNRQFTLIIKKNPTGQTRLGFTVSKKYGTSVERNKIKRRLREIIRNNKYLLVEGYDMVLLPKTVTKNMDYWELESSVKHIFNFTKKRMKKKSG